jgi:hypothetical protein
MSGQKTVSADALALTRQVLRAVFLGGEGQELRTLAGQAFDALNAPVRKPPTDLALHAAREIRDVVPAGWTSATELWKLTDLKWTRFRAGLEHAEEEGWVVRRFPRSQRGKAYFRRPSEAALKGGES